jgi:2-oxoglutarate ferredoxin oxidoreductase subunit alpha
VEAFNLAEEYQTPVILLSDQEIAQRKETVDPIDTSKFRIVDRKFPGSVDLEDYVRFKSTDSGISPISHPGVPGGNYLASGIEHTEQGAPTAKGEVHARMNDKRIRKFNSLKQRRDLFHVEGDPDAMLAMISWGSVAGVAREAMQFAKLRGLKVKLLVPILVYPVAEEIYNDFFAGVKRGLVIEQSHQGQLYRILRMFVNVPPGVESYCRSGANPIPAKKIVDRLQSMVLNLHQQRIPEPEPQ